MVVEAVLDEPAPERRALLHHLRPRREEGGQGSGRNVPAIGARECGGPAHGGRGVRQIYAGAPNAVDLVS